MKLNIANPTTGQQNCIEVVDEKKLRIFYDLRMGDVVDADTLGDEWKGYQFKITGGNDKQGFPMMQGVLKAQRVRLLLKGGSKCYRQRRAGERKKKSVRGCIVASDISILNLVVVQKGEGEIDGLTDKAEPRRLGPKRANKIRKLFNLSKKDDVRQYVIARTVTRKNGKEYRKAPKIQRLITPVVLQRKRSRKAAKLTQRDKVRADAAEYKRVYDIRMKERRESRRSEMAKRRSSRKSSRKAE
jgi:small subunit ribosomal protein S6e